MAKLTRFFEFSTEYDGYQVEYDGFKKQFRSAREADKYMLQCCPCPDDEIDYSIAEWSDGTWLIIRF